MAKRIEVIAGIFYITDTVSSVIEVRTPATNIFHTEYLGRIFFFLQIEDERTLGYLWSDFVDENDVAFGSLQDVLDWLDANIGEAAEAGFGILTSYRADFQQSNGYIYSGYLLNSLPFVVRRKFSIREVATGVTDLETAWTNRLALTYV